MKGFFQLLLFGGAVALLGVVIRGVNREAGWFDATHFYLEVDKPLDQSKFRMYLAQPFVQDDSGRIMAPIEYTEVLYDTAFVPEFPRVGDPNYLVLEYDSMVFPFVHHKWNADGQHDYYISLEMEDDTLLSAAVGIEGPESDNFYGQFYPKTDSLIPVYDNQSNRIEDEEEAGDPQDSTDEATVSLDSLLSVEGADSLIHEGR
ncbi:MAG: hypothetical protein AAGN35_24185 [Bacteroidota bacterium]